MHGLQGRVGGPVARQRRSHSWAPPPGETPQQPASWSSLAPRRLEPEPVRTSTAGREPGARAVREASPRGRVPSPTPVSCQKRRCHGLRTRALRSLNPGFQRGTALRAARTRGAQGCVVRKGALAPFRGTSFRKKHRAEVDRLTGSEHQLLWSTPAGRAILVLR